MFDYDEVWANLDERWLNLLHERDDAGWELIATVLDEEDEDEEYPGRVRLIFRKAKES